MGQASEIFSSKINTLNAEVLSSEMVESPFGRGYRDNDGSGYYTDLIHYKIENESPYHHAVIASHLRGSKASCDLYMGVAGMLNLTFAAASQAKHAILFDLNTLQKSFWDTVIDLIRETKTAEEFKGSFETLENQIKRALKKNGISQWKSPFRNNPQSFKDFCENHKGLEMQWLQSTKNYDHIRELARSGNIVSLTLDIADTEGVQHLLDCLEARTQTPQPNIVYISNIFAFLKNEGDWTLSPRSGNRRKKALLNLKKLAGSNTQIISAEKYDEQISSRSYKAEIITNPRDLCRDDEERLDYDFDCD